ncbi:FimV/HubP family polar landmark protein [Shewanella gaetbuli]
MTFRTSYWAGLFFCVATATSGITIVYSVNAETLKITGPNGEVKQATQQYGPTTPSDTFWSIAQKVRPNDQVTIYQVMAALFEANPHAFSGNNYNTLEKDMVLQIPSVETMLAIPKQDAKARAERDDRVIRQAKQSGVALNQVVTSNNVTTPAISEPKAATDTSTQVTTTQVTANAKPAAAEKPLQITQQVQKPIPETVKLTQTQQADINSLNNQLDMANNKSLMLIDELARAQEQLMVTRSDNQVLQQKIEELMTAVGEVEENLQLQIEKNGLLYEKNQQLTEQLAQASQPPIEQPTDFWRSLTDNLWVLIGLASLPLLLIFALVFWLLRRRSQSEQSQVATETVQENKVEATPEQDTDLEDLAIHLDDDTEESIDDLLDLEGVDVQPEAELDMSDDEADMAADIVITESDDINEAAPEDESTSLDDLWAEAMEEQESELEPLETDEDLDSLLDGLDDDLDTPETPAAAEDDLDALLAGLDTPEVEPEIDEDITETSEQDELDSLLADFDLPAETQTTDADSNADAEADLDDLLADFDIEPSADDEESSADEEEPSDDDIDALLAGFDAPAEADSSETSLAESNEAEQAETEEDLTDVIAAELDEESEADVNSLDEEPSADAEEPSDDDIDALLAGFDAPAEADSSETNLAESNEAEQAEKEEGLTDAIAAELDEESEADANSADEEPSADEEEPSDDDIDALLAGFDVPAEADSSETSLAESNEAEQAETEEDLTDAIAAELDEENSADANSADEEPSAGINEPSDDDIDALLAGFDAPAEAEQTEAEEDLTDAIAAELDEEPSVGINEPNDDDIDALLAGFDAPAEAEQTEAEEDLTDVIAAELDEESETDTSSTDIEEPALDSLLTELESVNQNTEDSPVEFDIEQEAEDDDLSSLIAELEQANETVESQDDLALSTSDADIKLDSSVDDAQQLTALAEGDVDDEMLLEAENELDMLLADMANEDIDATTENVTLSEFSDPVAKTAKDSGFFNDLKAADKPEENSLDWESNLLSAEQNHSDDLDNQPPTTGDSVQPQSLETDLNNSDDSDDFLAAFSESIADESPDDTIADEEFILSNDGLTVDEALAALDKSETNEAPLSDELSHFERENGFIDIDKLLNDADEEEPASSDKYKDVDVDMGEVEALIGNANMVDVDDEENSVNAKLDLARAYIEIDDEDSAKALLKEVQIDGNDRQQSEANTLLKKFN